MLCPSCGSENLDNAPECLKCHYKFQFGHAYNDPKSITFPNFLKAGSAKSKAVRIGVIVILFFAFTLMILSWIKSL